MERKQTQIMVRQAERVGVLIDGWNFARMCQTVDVDVDFEKLLSFLVGPGILVRAVFFLGEVGTKGQEAFLQRLRQFGYTVVTKPMKTYVVRGEDGAEERVSRCDFSVEFVLHATNLAKRCDRLYVLTSDGDYLPLIRALQNEGVRVVLVASTERHDPKGRTSKAVAGADLIEAVDEFVELKSIRHHIGKSYHGTW